MLGAMANLSRLLRPEWSKEQRAYMEWLALPIQERVPKTELALAKELGVERTTLYNWRKMPELHEEVYRLCRSLMGRHFPEVFACLEKEAKSGSLAHLRLYFEVMGLIGPG